MLESESIQFVAQYYFCDDKVYGLSGYDKYQSAAEKKDMDDENCDLQWRAGWPSVWVMCDINHNVAASVLFCVTKDVTQSQNYRQTRT